MLIGQIVTPNPPGTLSQACEGQTFERTFLSSKEKGTQYQVNKVNNIVVDFTL